MEPMGNPNALRIYNTKQVLLALKLEGRATKQSLAQRTGLSTVTVNTVLEQLTASGEAIADEAVPSNGGRPARSYRFNAAYRYVLALYLQEKTLHCSVADLNGVCVCREEEPMKDARAEHFGPAVERLLARYPAIGAIGFGLPGVVRDGVVTLSDHPGLTGVALADEYRARYHLPVTAENDVNLAVLGYCAEHGVEGDASVVYLYLPDCEAPGAGIYLNGGLCRGGHSFAGELRGLPAQTDWHALDRANFGAVCGAVSDVVQTIACILDPQLIVLHGAFLTEKHRTAIAEHCDKALEGGFLSELWRSQQFDCDYERGAIIMALGLLSEGEHQLWQPSF